MNDKPFTKPTIKIERGVCINCIHSILKDGHFYCNLLNPVENVVPNEYCIVDYKTSFGFEHK